MIGHVPCLQLEQKHQQRKPQLPLLPSPPPALPPSLPRHLPPSPPPPPPPLPPPPPPPLNPMIPFLIRPAKHPPHLRRPQPQLPRLATPLATPPATPMTTTTTTPTPPTPTPMPPAAKNPLAAPSLVPSLERSCCWPSVPLFGQRTKTTADATPPGTAARRWK